MIENHYLAPVIREILYYARNRGLAIYAHPEKLNLLSSSTPDFHTVDVPLEIGLKSLQFQACEALGVAIRDTQASRDYLFPVIGAVATAYSGIALTVEEVISEDRVQSTILELKRREVISQDTNYSRQEILDRLFEVIKHGRQNNPMPQIEPERETVSITASADCGFRVEQDRMIPDALPEIPENSIIEEFFRRPYLMIQIKLPRQEAESFWQKICQLPVYEVEASWKQYNYGRISETYARMLEIEADAGIVL